MQKKEKEEKKKSEKIKRIQDGAVLTLSPVVF